MKVSTGLLRSLELEQMDKGNLSRFFHQTALLKRGRFAVKTYATMQTTKLNKTP
jgi:hypothetical protein